MPKIKLDPDELKSVREILASKHKKSKPLNEPVHNAITATIIDIYRMPVAERADITERLDKAHPPLNAHKLWTDWVALKDKPDKEQTTFIKEKGPQRLVQRLKDLDIATNIPAPEPTAFATRAARGILALALSADTPPDRRAAIAKAFTELDIQTPTDEPIKKITAGQLGDLLTGGDIELPAPFIKQSKGIDRHGFPTVYKKPIKLPIPANLIIASRTGMGKTATLCHLAESFTRTQADPDPDNDPSDRVIFLTAEQSIGQIHTRILASRIYYSQNETLKQTHSPSINALRETAYRGNAKQLETDLNNAPLQHGFIITDISGKPIEAIVQDLRAAKAQFPNLQIALVDYLQRIAPSPDANTGARYLELGHQSALLADIAKELEIVVIAGAQLHRTADMKEIEKINLTKMRESGNIEQDADMVIAIASAPELDAGNFAFRVLKDRNGPNADANGTFTLDNGLIKIELDTDDNPNKNEHNEDNDVPF